MNANIILAGQAPDIVGSIGRGVNVGRNMFEGQRQNALAGIYQQHGPAIASGDPNALNVLAQFDPSMSLGVEQTRLGMDQTRLQMEATREQMAQRRQQAAAVAQQLAQAGRAEEAAAMLQDQQRLIATASSLQTPEEWDAFMAANDAPEYVGQFGNREGIIRGILVEAEGFSEALEFSMGSGPALQGAALTRHQQALAGGLVEGSPEYQEYMRTGGREEMGFQVLPDGTVSYGPGVAREPVAPVQAPEPAEIAPIEGADTAFGVGGVVRGGLNFGADMFNAPVPFPETQQAQSDLNLMAEDLLAGIAAGYPRQPPSWLLQEIRSLIPRAGTLRGASDAQARYQSIRRRLETDTANAQRALQDAVASRDRAVVAEINGRIRGNETALDLIDQAMRGIQGGGSSDEDAALIQRYLD